MLLKNNIPLLAVLGGLIPSTVTAIDVDVTSEKSLNDAASTALTNAMSFYDPSTGLLERAPIKYYWWEMGALLGTLVQRWSITGNDSMNKLISESMFFQPASMFAAPGLAPSHNRYMTAYEVKLTVALLETLAQVGLAKNFEPDEEKLELGNDDQAFWAFTVLDMAELGFPDPPPDKPSWLGLAQAVFNRQTAQWDDTTCGGGMRWQKFSTNTGYDYKNLPSNGGYFQIAARLARYTGNNTYVEYAEKMWDWISESGMWQEHNGRLELFDGVHISVCDKNKTAHDPPKFTYNIGFLLNGAAYLYDYSTGADKAKWRKRVDLLLASSDDFFFVPKAANEDQKIPPRVNGSTMAELQCEFATPQACNNDMPAFKGFLTRWLSMVSVLAPWTNETIYPRLVAGAQGAAKQCTGTWEGQIPGTTCGRRWYQPTWDSWYGVGEQMSAASAFQALNIHKAKLPYTAKKGGSSKSEPGQGNDDRVGFVPGMDSIYGRKITTGDRVGAGIVTALFMAFWLGGGFWLMFL